MHEKYVCVVCRAPRIACLCMYLLVNMCIMCLCSVCSEKPVFVRIVPVLYVYLCMFCLFCICVMCLCATVVNFKPLTAHHVTDALTLYSRL